MYTISRLNNINYKLSFNININSIQQFMPFLNLELLTPQLLIID